MNIAEASSHHVVMEAHDDVSGATGVAHVTFDVNQALIDHVLKAQYLCLRHRFTTIWANWYTPIQWSDAEGNAIVHDLSLELPARVLSTELAVSPETFWLRGRAGTAYVESETINIADFIKEQQAFKATTGEDDA